MAGTLYVVATPIGNLEDITFRAVRVLREVAVIAAEDTRRTRRLLQHYSISTPTTSLHAHNEHTRSPALVARLERGESVALVSDAGTPVVSDPGAPLVAAAHRAGIRVEPVPGPSAALAALSASGFAAEQVLFVGFPPNKSTARKQWFAELCRERRAIVFFEAPHRIRASLADLAECCGERPILVARELTKLHEELAVRPITGHIERLREPRGEYTVVLAPPSDLPVFVPEPPDPASLAREFGQLSENTGASRRDAIRILAEKYGLPAREMYKLVQTALDS